MEYPGYGVYRAQTQGPVSISSQILHDSEAIYDFLITVRHYDPSDIMIMGRSIGSGPSCHLAAMHQVAALILLSPFSSLRDAVRTLYGKIPSLLVRDRFINRQAIQEVTSPTLIIHGKSDTLIPYSHSQELHARCQGAPCKLVVPPLMTHNGFHDLMTDVLVPIRDFFAENFIRTSSVSGHVKRVPASCLRKSILAFQTRKLSSL
jgi:fermentation-respiration switch protein FrsA (DUF1100 family)